MLLKLASAIVLVHSWYPMECCSEQDCHPVPCEQLEDAPKGAVTWRDKLFEKQRVHPSKDAQCHICLHGEGQHPICVFVQQGV